MLKNTLENKEDGEIQDQLNFYRAQAEKANLEYKKDFTEIASSTKRIYSMDLQKLIILPIIPQSKSAIFTSRLVVLNLTFATLSKQSKNNSFCLLWHKALGGHKAESIVDALLEVIRKERDVSHFVFWADNCTSQNKNWVLNSSLITEVNRSDVPHEIVIRYLTKGHTHMSADGIHGNIEQKILRSRNIYDFQELTELVNNSRKNVEDDYKELDFLQKKKHCPSTFTSKTLNMRGISSDKKAIILKNILPLMPENRKFFWQSLPDSETSLDLVDHEQMDAIDSNI
ncbi:unnamed protein product [Diabrotica balteata]|uniref:DUF7869 domain-containing protein n=1 Tax=Diabrotica balteata TaxID=107213 RepID=A0A9N9XGN2_DIABA|nr:unnamed protein product [Diabrotica balteata]